MFGRIVNIEVRPYQPPRPVAGLAELFGPLRRHPYAMLLLSGGDLDCARYSLMGWDPFLAIRAKGNHVSLEQGSGSTARLGNPFTVLEDILGSLELSGPAPQPPFAGGGLGFFTYDLKSHLERLPATAVDDLGLPDLVLAFPSRLVIHDRRAGEFWQLAIHYEDAAGRYWRPEDIDVLQTKAPPGPYQVGHLQSNFTREAYLKSVTRIRDYIRQGDVYQVNLSQPFSFPITGDSYSLFQRLFALNPAPFYAYLNCRDFQILSTSMERFLWRRRPTAWR